ncbi:hypothetical protein PsorP6_002997 [Peronosclerospora sorghi]|uniref:Uncharacterized protein n=1 Tax=Peronosclerospora sorghi TaxID=230839 RepID=A0ACC0VP02_9STRA|nr:hypothetical protein PsorP6_002997 [Peronosclerospora sorghi]
MHLIHSVVGAVEAYEDENHVGINVPNSSISHSEDTTVASNRFLRFSDVPSSDDEMESRISLAEADKEATRWIMKTLNNFSTATLLAIRTTPDQVFKMLEINKAVRESKGHKILLFLRYVKGYREKFGEEKFPVSKLYHILETSTGAKGVATISHQLQEIDDLKPLGEKLQSYQFELGKKQQRSKL